MHSNKRHSDLLIKLSQGTISEKERWELERASLDDKFLADAIEGYYNSSEKHNLPVISNDKNKPIRRSLIQRWIGIAATLLILFSISFWAFSLSQEKTKTVTAETSKQEPIKTLDNDVIEKEEKLESESEIEVLEVEEGLTYIEYNNAAPATTTDSNKEVDSSVSRSKKKSRIKNKQSKEEVPNRNKVRKANDVSSNNLKKESETGDAFIELPPEEIAEEPNVILLESLDDIEQVPLQLIKGTVRDISGTPIANVVLKSSEGDDLAFTDTEGTFEMELEEDESFIAQADGFVSQRIKAKSNLNINLRKAEESLSNSPKRLAELMSISDLKIHYNKLLSNYFKSHNVSLCKETFTDRKRIKMIIFITNDNSVENIKFDKEIELPCQMSIEDIIRQAGFDNLFDGSQTVNFQFELRQL